MNAADTPLLETNPLLGLIEQMLSRQLQASTAARTRLKALNGKTLALELTGIGLNVYVACRDDAIGLSTTFADDADVIITGTPLAMLAFARSQDAATRGSSVKFTGDIGVAQDFQQLFTVLSPDFEEELSRLIGDEAAYRVHTAGKNFFTWARQAVADVSDQLAVVITEQRRDTPTADEIEAFLDQVDKIRADVDRAAARADRLARSLATAD
ncbi:MAG: hypothetical protein HKN70_00750 [Gammaproteobacteria bacterium]|nr:hypothetical protein [Gammaproteobacteria bacterium]